MSLELMPARDRRAITKALARDGRAALDKVWAHTPYVRGDQPDCWKKRAVLAGMMLLGKSVTDIGCGNQYLAQCLPAGSRYVPVDFHKHDAGVIRCDLNRDPVPLTGTDAAAVLGVMEYLDDPTTFLWMLRAFPHVVISFNCAHMLERRASRLGRYWIQHYTRRQVEALFAATGFRIVERHRLRFSEYLYSLERI